MKKPIPFGKYYLLERINVGGMAEVFRAKAYGVEGFERLVAVKRILPNIAEDKEFIKMFIDEAKIAVQLNHANIAQIFDLGMVDNHYYIALEHIHGRDLRAIFDRCQQAGAPMPVAQACFVVMKVCEGLDYAHNKRDASGRELGLVHRDVSPQNMLVSFDGEVKLIDFGIAKAAGKGSKTQAGILKGKFGYMSPEQVRGLPIDRRSDVFSCGIVLYELLTGERLFQGESDFSTLEKVRNVEILPPSTYNRKIPDELERIVLKALARDVEERYQNAIDLHDELQAFVYTAGEFYSRKDLSTWMKSTFAKEIEAESARLDELSRTPAPERIGARARRGTGAQESLDPKATLAMPPAIKPPKPPPVPPGRGRPPSRELAAQPPAPVKNGAGHGHGLEWDDDELETSIYDNPQDDTKQGIKRAPERGQSGAMPAVAAAAEPDLASLARTARGWAQGGEPGASQSRAASSSANAAPVSLPPPSGFGPGPGLPPPSHLGPQPSLPPGGPARHGSLPPPPQNGSNDPSAVVALANLAASRPIYEPTMPATAYPERKKGTPAWLIAAVVTALLAGAIVVGVIVMSNAGSDGPAAVASEDTGIQLAVDPAKPASQVKLDGKALDRAPPLMVTNMPPGEHKLEIVAPPGFFNKTETVTVEAGEVSKLEIELEAMDITGKFTSDPESALVTLFINGERMPLGQAPAQAKLDPRKSYEVLFELAGYAPVKKPVTIVSTPEIAVAATLSPADDEDEGKRVASSEQDEADKARRERVRERIRNRDRDREGDREVVVRKPDPEPDPEPDREQVEKERETRPEPAGDGTLLIGSKPPCQIFVDGKDTGLRTPQRDITLSAGRHRITLVNNQFGIRESFSVTIRADDRTRVIKDLTSKIQ